jgi:thiamine biosynthesis lipoprotein
MLLRIRFFQIGLFFFFIALFSCSSESEGNTVSLHKLYGKSQGTTYLIQVYDNQLNFEAREIDSLLNAFDKQLSTYDPSSLISRFNEKDFKDTVLPINSRFFSIWDMSDAIYQETNGIFDPSIKPIMDLWGFDEDNNDVPKKESIDSALQFVSFENGLYFKISLLTDSSALIVKKVPRFQLDFNAIAQGYSVDLLLEFINSKGHQNVYVELGGEIAVSGVKFDQEKWRIGVESPIENNRSADRVIQKVFELKDKRIATSGNYRKFFEANGKKYAHTINPLTGYQNRHNLLSATVFSDYCWKSDACATFFMLIGVEATQAFLKEHPDLDLEVFLIYAENDSYKTYLSEGLISAQQ